MRENIKSHIEINEIHPLNDNQQRQSYMASNELVDPLP